MPHTRRETPRTHLAVFVCVLTSATTAPSARSAEEICFYSEKPTSTDRASGCGSDPLGLANLAPIRAAISAFGLDRAQVRIVGCANGRFGVARPRETGDGVVYQINYPLAPGRAPAAYVAPLVHELGHVFQLRQSGSMETVLAARGQSRHRVELGADFLSGVVFRTHLSHLPRSSFQTSADLSGSYRVNTGDLHGSPEERTAAFRMGYYVEPPPQDLRAAEAAFQDDDYGRIRAMSE